MKRALLVGCTYKGTSAQLNGTLNDVIRMRQCLIDKYNFESKNIDMLIEWEGYKQPTKKNIIDSIVFLIIKSLYYGCDTIYIHFSGHGTQILDRSGDEADGYDECWVPVDYEDVGVINDDFLNNYFKWFPKTCKLTCVVDACHSSSCLDLSYKIDTSNNTYELMNKTCKCDNDNIVLISGCKSDQCSLDTVKNGSWGGALTFAVLQAIYKHTNVTFYEVVDHARQYMIQNNFEQIPQLCSSKKITSGERFIL